MFSTPGNFSDKIKEKFMDMFINRFHIVGANIINQSLLSLYSYNATSGIVVDIGERLEIVPVTDGKETAHILISIFSYSHHSVGNLAYHIMLITSRCSSRRALLFFTDEKLINFNVHLTNFTTDHGVG